MKITYKTAAQTLLLLAACLTAVAQSEIAPDHFPDQASPVAFAPRQEAQVRPLQTRLEDYEKLLQAKLKQVENARQEAISAGVVGDGAGPFIDAYREQQMELEALQAALTPKIEKARKVIAGLTNPDSAVDSLLSQKGTPVRPKNNASLSRDSRGRKQSKSQLIASHDSSKIRATDR